MISTRFLNEHRFAAALLASVIVHGTALTISMPARKWTPPPPDVPLEVRFIAPEPPPVPQITEPPPRVEPPPPQKPPKPRAEKKPPVVKPAPAPEPEPPPVVSEVAPEPPPPQAPPEPAPRVEAPPPAAEPPPPPVAKVVPRGPPRELVESYGRSLSQALGRYKEYPRLAQMRGWEGSVTMRLRVAPNGNLIEAALHTSSGYEVLDRQALAMAHRSQRLPPPPEGLRDGEISVLVPVVFRLERE
jgi:periplasmic protein TonB